MAIANITVPAKLQPPTLVPNPDGIVMPTMIPLACGTISVPLPMVNRLQPVPSVNMYPRGGFDTSNFFTGQCPVCGQSHHVYSQGGYVCYGLGPANGVAVVGIVQQGKDLTNDAWSVALLAQDFVIES